MGKHRKEAKMSQFSLVSVTFNLFCCNSGELPANNLTRNNDKVKETRQWVNTRKRQKGHNLAWFK